MNISKSVAKNNEDTEIKVESFTRSKKIPFQHLAPTDTVDDETTFTALDFALNQKEIKNIAVTGTYGSGKSSILRTYEKKYTKKYGEFWKCKLFTKKTYYNFLNISLATFVIEDKQKEQEKLDIPETTLQKIEKSILQQIFYKKSGSALPYSRFRRIRNLNFLGSLIVTFILFTILLFPIKFFKPEYLVTFKNMVLMRESGIHGWLVSWTFTISIFIIIFFTTRLLNKIKINKIGFQSTDIDLENTNEHSLLNKYLDEVLYFFEATNFNVVVIEDLDRFKNTEVFIKLRELNTLINNYEKIKRKIVFIYALRDEVFCDSSRTKFFEFIIPVIPVINNQNSGNILLKIKNENKESALQFLDNNFLFDISLYIDDMRLLKNCINEFRIYDEKINPKNKDKFENKTDIITNDYNKENQTDELAHNRNKILALIIYKNLYPKDFADLSFNKGFLHGIFERKNTIVNERITELKEEIQELQQTIIKKNGQGARNIAQLRTLYVAEILKQTTNYSNARAHNYISDTEFEKIRNGTTLSVNYYNGYGNVLSQNITYVFSEIEKLIDPEQTYTTKAQILNTNTSELQEKIAENETEIKTLKKKNVAQLLSTIEMTEKLVEKSKGVEINTDFVTYLLRSGKIEEDYFDYISYFYEGELSRKDKDFLLLVKNNQKPIFDMPLNNVENVIQQIRDDEWELPAILNLTLIKSILKANNANLSKFITTMYKHEKINTNNSFFKQFLCDDEFKPFWYQKIYEVLGTRNTLFSTLFNNTNLEQFYDFFIFTDVDNKNVKYEDFIQKNISFLYKNISDGEKEIITDKLVLHKVTFDFNDEIIKYTIFENLINNNLYNITNKNLTYILKFYDKDIQTEITDFLTQIIKLGLTSVNNYLWDNISITVKNVLLLQGVELNESEEVFIELLNSDELAPELKCELIKNNKKLITDITKVKVEGIAKEEGDIWVLLVAYKKIQPNWENVLEYFKHCSNVFDNALLTFLNNRKIITQIKNEIQQLDKELKGKILDCDVVNDFYWNVLENDTLDVDSFKALMSVCPLVYNSLKNYAILNAKKEYLINNNKLSFTQENYDGLKLLANKEATEKVFLSFIDKKFADFINSNKEEFIELKDLLRILQNILFKKEQKKTIIQTNFIAWNDLKEEADLVQIGTTIAETLCVAKLDHIPLISTLSVMYEKNVNTAIKILDLQLINLTDEEINQIFTAWGESYQELIIRDGKKISIKYAEELYNLCNKLYKRNLIASVKKKAQKIEIFHKRK